MKKVKEELTAAIEKARDRLDNSIESQKNYEEIYQNSVELDRLIELYLVSGN